jgi:hypothetical protein
MYAKANGNKFDTFLQHQKVYVKNERKEERMAIAFSSDVIFHP